MWFGQLQYDPMRKLWTLEHKLRHRIILTFSYSQGSANFFGKSLSSKCFMLFRLFSICCNCSAIVVWKTVCKTQHLCVPVKLYSQIQVMAWIWAVGLLELAVFCSMEKMAPIWLKEILQRRVQLWVVIGQHCQQMMAISVLAVKGIWIGHHQYPV